jgi:hypothetical protein
VLRLLPTAGLLLVGMWSLADAGLVKIKRPIEDE